MSPQVAAEPHRVEWLIDNASEPYAKFICSAPVGALCRSWCAVGCEEFCTEQPTRHRQADGTVVVIGHPWEDSGECRITTWLENLGTPGELYMGDDNEPLRSGPIETDWDGDCYRWQYSADAAEAVQ